VLIRAGFDIRLAAPVELPILCALAPYPGLVQPIYGSTEVRPYPPVPVATYRDGFGNQIARLTAPPGGIGLFSDFIVRHSGEADPVAPWAEQHRVADLPDDVLVFLLPSRYVESDALATEAWERFGNTRPGWSRVQAVCDFVNGHIRFGYQYGRPTKTALEAFREGTGVCRDFAHLGVAFCRALNIPARYASGYLGDIGVPVVGEMDFAGWFEAYLGGRWYTFDPRNNASMPRIGRILVVRGRDAADVAMITSFGAHEIKHFEVWTDEVPSDLAPGVLQASLRGSPTPFVAASRYLGAAPAQQGGLWRVG